MKNLFLKSNKGFMTVEMLISAFIITMSVLATMNITQRSTYLSRQTFHGSQAVFLAEEAAEALRIMRDNGWSNISSKSNGIIYYLQFTGGTWTLTTNSAYSKIGALERKIIFHAVKRDNSTKDIVESGGTTDTGTREVTINVNWYEGTQYYDKVFSYYIFDLD